MRALVVAFVVGLIVPALGFLVPLHVEWRRAVALQELDAERVDAAPPGARALSDAELDALPALLQGALRLAVAQGSASVTLAGASQALHIPVGGAVVLVVEGAPVLAKVILHETRLDSWEARAADGWADARAWIAARLGAAQDAHPAREAYK